MDLRFAGGMVLGMVLLNGCREKPEVTVTETRPLTTRDAPPRLDATSAERFGTAQPQPKPLAADPPAGWTKVPPTEFRQLNYRFGPSGTGEVWVSTSAGSVLDNVNRWRRQFGEELLDAAACQALPTLPLLGTTGVLVTAEGDYTGGMGQPPRTGYGLAGVVAEFQRQIITVKMVGPAAEVREAQAVLEAFAKSLRPAQ